MPNKILDLAGRLLRNRRNWHIEETRKQEKEAAKKLLKEFEAFKYLECPVCKRLFKTEKWFSHHVERKACHAKVVAKEPKDN